VADSVNVTIRCNDCRQDLVTLWNTAPGRTEPADLVFWRSQALTSHRRANPTCSASGANLQEGWPKEAPAA
jgi:hypothetical protein